MLVQIFTDTQKKDNDFSLNQTLYYDFVKMEKQTKTLKTESDFLADAYNVGYAMKFIVDEDYKFNVNYKINDTNGHRRKKENLIKRTAVYANSNSRRYASIYTNNQLLVDNIYRSISKVEYTKVILRLQELAKNYLISVQFRESGIITNDEIESWKEFYK